MKPDFNSILDECLSRLNAGEEPERVLVDYPEQAPDLRPLLVLASQVRSLPVPQASPAAKFMARKRMLEAFETRQESLPRVPLRAQPGFWSGLKTTLLQAFSSQQNRAIRYALVGVLVLFLASSRLIVSASASTLPGDALYPVKRGWEQVQLTVTLDEEQRESLQRNFQEERQEEVYALIELGREEEVDYEGMLEEVTTLDWIVSGLVVHLTENTVLEGIPSIGQEVAIRALLQSDGSLVAQSIALADADEPPGKGPVQVIQTSQQPSEPPAAQGTPGRRIESKDTEKPPKSTEARHSTKTPQPSPSPRRTLRPDANSFPSATSPGRSGDRTRTPGPPPTKTPRPGIEVTEEQKTPPGLEEKETKEPPAKQTPPGLEEKPTKEPSGNETPPGLEDKNIPEPKDTPEPKDK